MTDPEITAVKLSYSLSLSNGNYGSERVEVSYWATVGPDQDADELECELAGRARDLVEGRLKASRFEAVREALETPEERRARLEAAQAAWEAERTAREARRAAMDEGDGAPSEEPGGRPF